ncbi:TetR family transcriptional regulator [Cupriavidus gilardii J11]|uniref:TetR family transcriptional regulator n=1 Tax=Cupriavidus gilardii J11 TaxID=936133 RepID=A0A562BJR9_9BURK|nr:TetR/AcrR family transcriptional regulator [Cupriavidus gilardii]TWG85434.1 TetR family transcriptional regulator [Cupriavidus gilardii J11]
MTEHDDVHPRGIPAASSATAATSASSREARPVRNAATDDGVSVRQRLLDQALALICKRGFNGFSYRDLAERVGVKTSSIHYYFPTKEDLALEAVNEYSARIARHIASIDTALPIREQAEQYLAPWRSGCKAEQVCLAGMLAAESESLPPSVHAALQGFHRLNEEWLAGLLERAAAEVGDLPEGTTAEALAKVLFGALQNGLVSARLFGQTDRVEPAAGLLLAAVSRHGQQLAASVPHAVKTAA